MNKKTKLFSTLAFSTLLLTMCRFYDAGGHVTPINGLSCQGYTDYFGKGSVVSKGLECYYTCQQEVVGPLDFETDPSLSGHPRKIWTGRFAVQLLPQSNSHGTRGGHVRDPGCFRNCTGFPDYSQFSNCSHLSGRSHAPANRGNNDVRWRLEIDQF